MKNLAGLYDTDHLKSGQMGHHFVKKPLENRTIMSGFRQSHFQMVGTIAIAKDQPFENWTFKKSGFQMFLDYKRSDLRSPPFQT